MIEEHLLVTNQTKGAPSDTGACIVSYPKQRFDIVIGETFKGFIFLFRLSALEHLPALSLFGYS